MHGFQPLLDQASAECEATIVDAEDPLFIFIHFRFYRQTKRDGALYRWIHGVRSLFRLRMCFNIERERRLLVHCRHRLDYRTQLHRIWTVGEWRNNGYV